MMRRMNMEQDGDLTLEGEVGGEVYNVSNKSESVKTSLNR